MLKLNLPLIILNPTAGDGLAINRWNIFQQKLNQKQIKYTLKKTEYKRHATQISSDAIKEGIDKIAVFGGDGTLNEVLQGIMGNDIIKNPNLKLIFLPGGSSCDFEKKFENPKKLIDRFLTEDYRLIDIFKVRCQNTQGDLISRYIINNSTIGVISLANEKFNSVTGFIKWIKQKSVDLSAVLCGIQAIINFSPIKCNISIDSNKLGNIELSNIFIFKTSHFGGNMHYGIKPIQNDGKLSVVTIKSGSKLYLLSLISDFFTGNILKRDTVEHYYCTSIKIESDDFTIIETDGENIGTLPAKYSVIPRALKIIV